MDGPLSVVQLPWASVSTQVWNTVYLERATNALRNHELPMDEALFQYLSPLGWEHINLTGSYHWRGSTKVGTWKFRPLRLLPMA